MATPPGACSQFRKVLHVAVMDYRPDTQATSPDFGTIRRILENIESLLLAESDGGRNAVRLALPMMGTGVGALDKRKVLEIYRDFFKRECGFECSVILYAHSERDCALMHEVCGG